MSDSYKQFYHPIKFIIKGDRLYNVICLSGNER